MSSDVILNGDAITLQGATTEATGKLTVDGGLTITDMMVVDPTKGIITMKARGRLDFGGAGTILSSFLFTGSITGNFKNTILIENNDGTGPNRVSHVGLMLGDDAGKQSAAFHAADIQLANPKAISRLLVPLIALSLIVKMISW